MAENRNQIWCRYNSTGIELRNQSNWQQSSWSQISKSSWLYICISIRIFQLMWNICDCLFSLCSLSYNSSSACQEVLQSRVTLVINLLKHQFDQSLSTTLLVILPRIQPVRLDWSPSLLGSFAVHRVMAGIQPASLNYTGNTIAVHCIGRLRNMIPIYINFTCRVISELWFIVISFMSEDSCFKECISRNVMKSFTIVSHNSSFLDFPQEVGLMAVSTILFLHPYYQNMKYY